MVQGTVLMEFIAHTVRNERCNENIGIQDNPHETLSNTS